ncbi:MAG: VOC family protein, partial [Actinomycetota bacterium]|nr:VOC family protein [Actinomycetota bacterium]
MRLDHVSYAAGPDGLDATAARLASRLGTAPVDGGVHPGFGTRNRILPLTDGHYLEVVEALDHPAVDQMPFGQAVR